MIKKISILIITFLLVLTLKVMAPALALAETANSSITTSHTKVTLISDVSQAKVNEYFWLGLKFENKPGWHIYYKNPGDSGLAPKIVWETPTMEADEIDWPIPEKLPLGPLVNYGYSGEVLLPIKAKVTSSVNSSIEIKAQVSWLICMEDCIPEKGIISLTLPTSLEQSTPSDDAKYISSSIESLPKPYAKGDIYEISKEGEDLLIEIPTELSANKTAYIFAAIKGIIKPSAEQILVLKDKSTYIKTKATNSLKELPEAIEGILVLTDKSDSSQTSIKISPVASNIASFIKNTSKEEFILELPLEEQKNTDTQPLILLIFLAMLGGIILNLMPCVLPVLSIKVFSLIDHKNDSRSRQLLLAACYALGTILSLLTLAAILLILRAGGSEIGWGFQLQHASVVGLLALFFTIMGVSFLGFLNFGEGLAQKAAQLDRKEGFIGAFLSGLLATLVATPCTAPFMGTAVGVALFRPWYQALLIFASLGFGIALPYVLLVIFPSFQKILPRPGNWMVTLKEFFAFPLFATSIWLLWVLGAQRGGAGVVIVLTAILTTLFGLWLWKVSNSQKNASIKKSILKICSALIIVFGILIVPLPDLLSTNNSQTITTKDGTTLDGYGLSWYPYSTKLVSTAKNNHELIYLDFTAAWCITCQVNKKLVFSDQRVIDFIKSNNVKLIRADWTNQDPEITRALASFNRASVPLNIIYHPNSSEPVVLPSILTAQTVLDYLEP